MSEIYYSVSEAAYILGVSEESVLRAIRKGEIEAFWKEACAGSPGRGYRITISELEEFMYKHQSKRSMGQIGRGQEKRIREDYLETLYEREDRLFDAIIFIEEIKGSFGGFGV